MRKLLIAVFCLSSYAISKAEDPKPEDKKPQICWEGIELYDDSKFTKKMDKNSWMYKKVQAGLPKYEKMVKQETEKVLAEEGMELVECPKHPTPGSGLKQVAEEDKPLHMKISLAYDGIFTITVYVRVEVFRGDNKVITFDKQRSATIWEARGKKKRKVLIINFGRDIVKEMSKKIGELEPEEKKEEGK